MLAEDTKCLGKGQHHSQQSQYFTGSPSPTGWHKGSQVVAHTYIAHTVDWVGTITFHKCANIYTDPCDVFEYFVIVQKRKNNAVFNYWKNDNFHCYLSAVVIKYLFFISSHVCYYFYQLSSLLDQLFHMLSISTIWPKIQKLWALMGCYFHLNRLSCSQSEKDCLPHLAEVSTSQQGGESRCEYMSWML